jgi:hypothetical protein
MKKFTTLLVSTFSVFVISWTANAAGIEATTDEGKRVLLNDDMTWQYMDAFDVIVGEWIEAEDSAGEFMSINPDGQVCFKEHSADDSCHEFTFIVLGDNRFGMKEDDRYVFAFAGDVIVGFKRGKRFNTYKRSDVNEDIKYLLITNNGVMKTCYRNEPKYLSIKGDEISGLIYGILSRYSDMTGLKIEYRVESSLEECLTGMEEGTYDIMVNLNEKAERKKYMDYYLKKDTKSRGLYISKKSPFAKFTDELQQTADFGL